MSSDATLYDKVAKKVLSETLRVKKGESLTIETWNNGLPLARLLVLEARRIGAIPLVIFEDESAYVEGVKVAPKDMLGAMGKHESGLISGTDAYVFIPGTPLSPYPPRLSRQEAADSTRYNAAWYGAAEKARLRGARLAFGYVGKEYARLYGKRPEEIVRHQLTAALADFSKISATGRSIGKLLQDDAEATLLTGAGRLEFKLKGDLEIEDGIVDEEDLAGGSNMTYVPPGMVSKQVDPASANGKVGISPSVTRLGLLSDAQLEFESGRLVAWGSKKSPKMLNELVEGIPTERRTFSSFTVGINTKMRYENGQDRMVAGAVGIAFGLSGTVRRGTLSVAGKPIVEKGALAL